MWTVFFRVLGHNGRSLKDAIGANAALYHGTFSFGEEIRWHAAEKNRERCVAVSQVEALARISHNGIISRAASAENTFTSMIRGDQHYCHGDNWTPMAAIRLCTSQCPIRRHSYSLVADSADNPQISAA